MDKTTSETKKPAAKKPAPRKPAPHLIINNTNLFGWIISVFFVCGCMFFLGVMVGRNTAPVQFDIDRLLKNVSGLPDSILKTETPETLQVPPINQAAEIDLPEINDAIIEHLKDRDNPPEIYEQYIPPVLTPKYAKTPPVQEKPAPAPATETKPACPPAETVAETVAELTPEIRPTSNILAPKVAPEPEKKMMPPVPPPPPKPVEPKLTGSEFAIQVASVQDAEKARMLMTRFREKGYPAYCQSSAVDGVTWHRVRIGPYPDRTLASRDQERLKAAGVDSLVIAMHQITP
jgi:cell division septation protein DedD